MTFLAQETSAYDGQPNELYQIAVGSDQFNLTSGEDAVDINSVTYEPVPITRRNIQIGPDDDTNVLEFTMPSNHPFAQKYVNIVPGSVATVTILRYHRTDVTEETRMIFTGRVRSVAFSLNGVSASVGVLPLSGGLGRNGPRYVYSILCNHNLYDTRCKVPQSSHQFTGTVSAINGRVYTIPGLGANGINWARGGFAQVGSVDFRLIRKNSGGGGDNIQLILPFDDSLVQIGTTLDIFAGCDRKISTCKDEFDNVINFGGYAWVPRRKIFRNGLQ